MNCLVTGAAGFIGGTLTRRLVSEGHRVLGIIHHTKPAMFDNQVNYVSGDITDSSFVQMITDKIDVVFHCAAFVKDYGPKEFFYRINVEGTNNLIEASEKSLVKKFIFLSHITYESDQHRGYYQKTKAMAEQCLMRKYEHEKFPVVIIRPGNVYGPGATTWVLRPLRAIQKNRIALIDGGNGIFLHTYIDNLIDALLAVINESRAIGKIIDITDGDNSTTWGTYLNALAKMAHAPPITKHLSKGTALWISRLMMIAYKLFKIEPWVSPVAVEIFTNNQTVSIDDAKDILQYTPKIDLKEGLQRVEQWLKSEGYLS